VSGPLGVRGVAGVVGKEGAVHGCMSMRRRGLYRTITLVTIKARRECLKCGEWVEFELSLGGAGASSRGNATGLGRWKPDRFFAVFFGAEVLDSA
jgi:hypothetical protein